MREKCVRKVQLLHSLQEADRSRCRIGIFLGIYGGSLVEANEQYVKERRRKLKKDIVHRIEENATGRSSRDLDVNDEEEEREPSLLREIWDIVVLETPIMILVIIIGQIIGHFEGWNFIERCVGFYFVRSWGIHLLRRRLLSPLSCTASTGP